ncbi:DUF6221 family protein [Rhodococcus sp. IEGM 1409]|uniref:DUF6221 family protein n=1 Tax=Rhodococcus sp. IEGM 1409 TaxID=3047082 RepID=UPI0024B798B3|nr:DUF6221 family protein [Rhodococcus sp. IEGM 1409]MDI9901321.1 DUF6221 family protein [Rhodococcus sp. IEGM 1409]
MDIVEFLEARLDEDEADATEADGDRLLAWSKHDKMVIVDSGFMQTFTPSRILREVAAKRAIIAALKDGDLRLFPGLWKAAELLAIPYSDHPDYAKVESIFPDRPTGKTRLM